MAATGTVSSASSYDRLLVQQMYDARPSPTLEVNKTLDVGSDYSPGHTPCPSPGLGEISSNHQYHHHNHNHGQDKESNVRNTAPVASITPASPDPSSSYYPAKPTAAPPPTPITSPSVQTAAKKQQQHNNNNNKINTITSRGNGNGQQRLQTSTAADTATATITTEPSSPTPSVHTPVRASNVEPGATSTSPKGVSDVFSLSTDKQLADRYTFVEEIGYGNWGSVWKIIKRHPQKRELATKLVFRTKDDKTTPARVKSIWQEFKVIRNFKKDPHPNIIHFYDFILTPSYALVTMDIHNKLMPTHVPEATARSYFKGLLSAVDYLHSRGVSHNDIKPANILLSLDNEPIIVDFGFANQWSLTSSHATHAFMTELSWGTPEYLSPERATQSMHDERLSDIWSLGVTMYEIVVGRTPFERDETEEFLTKEALEVYYKRTVAGTFLGSYKLSLAFEDLVRQMVEPSVSSRMPSCARGLKHPFFSLRPPSVLGGESRPPSVYGASLPNKDLPTFKIDTLEKQQAANKAGSVFKAPLADIDPNKSGANATTHNAKSAGQIRDKVTQKETLTAAAATVTVTGADGKASIATSKPKPVSPAKSTFGAPIDGDARERTAPAGGAGAGADGKRKLPPNSSPSKKVRNEIKIFKDPVPAQATASNITARGYTSTSAAGAGAQTQQKTAIPVSASNNSSGGGGRSTAAVAKPEAKDMGTVPSISAKSGLRPLLLRAESAQSLRAPAKSFIDGNPLMSTPTKKFGQVANTWSAANNGGAAMSSSSSTTVASPARSITDAGRPASTPRKSVAGNRVSVAQTRDSKELRSPESLKTLKNTKSGQLDGNKENLAPAPSPVRKLAPSPSKPELSKTARLYAKAKSNLTASTSAQPSKKEASPPPFTKNVVPLIVPPAQPEDHAEKKSKLSKRRPSMKSQKSSSALSFSSLSSSFKGTRGKSLDGRHFLNKDLEEDYAIVERDGRVSFDGVVRPSAMQHQVDLHIRAPPGEKEEVIQERIISLEAQRAYGESMQQEVSSQRERSFLSRSNSFSGKKLPDAPVPVGQEPMPNAPAAKIRASLTPSFANGAQARPYVDDAYGGMQVGRCDSRQSDMTVGESQMQDQRSDSRQSVWSGQDRPATSHSYVQQEQHNDIRASFEEQHFAPSHKYQPSVSISNTHSGTSHSHSAKHVRSCWSPETVPSEGTPESDYGDERTDREDEGDDTIHAAPVPEIRRTSAVFNRAPRAESIYQSFICTSPTIDILSAPRPNRSPPPRQTKIRSDSLNASTWSHSSRQMMAPTPDALREYSRLAGLRDATPSPYTLFPPPEDLRTLASPPPRPETSQSRKTISRMRSFFGRFGFGRER